MKTVIFASGTFTDRKKAQELCRQAGLIIAADGGIRHCWDVKVSPHVLLGDLDSASAELVDWAEKSGAALLRYSRDKDKTDLELALDLARSRGATTISLFGALGGRWDMSLANLLLPAAPTYENLQITLYDGPTRIDLLRSGDRREVSATPGSRVSLIPVNGQAEGVTLTGFKYPLTDHTIHPGSTLGISNVLVAATGFIVLRKGMLLCILTATKDTKG